MLIYIACSPSGLNLCVPLLYHKVHLFVPLKVHLEKDVDYALCRISSCHQESIFLVAPGIAVVQCELILYDILPSPSSHRLRHRVHARGAFLALCRGYSEDNVADVSSFKRVSRVCRTGSQCHTSRAKFLQWLATYAFYVCSVFSKIFFLLATWTLTKLRPPRSRSTA